MENYEYAPISVIIPCYKSYQTISRAISSVWEQTIRPIEVIVVDDFSNDNKTTNVLKELANLYPVGWIQIVELSINKGPGNARNIAWDKASQPYIAFLDADDSWHPYKIEIQYKWMEANPEVYMTGHAFTQYKDHKSIIQVRPEEYTAFYKVDSKKLLLSNVFSTPSVMLKREIPIRFESEKKYSEDYLLWLEINLGGYQCWRIDLPLTFLHKSAYGESGLSGNLIEMQKGELETYSKIKGKKLINMFELVIYKTFSCAKFLIRYLRS